MIPTLKVDNIEVRFMFFFQFTELFCILLIDVITGILFDVLIRLIFPLNFLVVAKIESLKVCSIPFRESKNSLKVEKETRTCKYFI